MTSMIDRLPTGIDSLDRLLDGGIPRGSLVKLAAPPNSQAEILIHEMVAARPTVYLTTMRPAPAVRDSLDRAGVPPDGVAVKEFGPASSAQAAAGAPSMLREAIALIDEIPPETTVVVDPVDVFEWAETDDYLGFLNDLSGVLTRTNSIGVLHCLDGQAVPDHRDVTDYVADIAFQLSADVTDDGIDTRLSVPKFRGRSAPQETVKLDLSGGITVDLSRNIA
ncbi:RecA-superfamily ATPase implicated in signal transduction, inactivated [Halanaeroarchaeum sp. HSR-CO]|uniref:RAD55 family ATPase n=1 Tax=Halanaeroarchaeum sp. HSR-CO TaxID=2866382 RepID=UPI00217D537B|nr:ATPase domain-containing protein [Halanaeroarchaeum sp. HSR-CO]UWG46971.1 RecA-superfamily ATPase implicated in signal transduction, inactivated [Halanaeroarchaeum sp. HSR-CO]